MTFFLKDMATTLLILKADTPKYDNYRGYFSFLKYILMGIYLCLTFLSFDFIVFYSVLFHSFVLWRALSLNHPL